MKAREKNTVLITGCLLLAAIFYSCNSKTNSLNTYSDHSLPDTLRVVTLYSPTSYFIYRDEPMGYDYSLVNSLAEQKGMTLDLKVATSLSGAIEMLDSGLVDLIAYEVPVTSEYRERVLACGPLNETSQVLVQPRLGRDTLITDVTQLVGRDVYVEADSKYLQRIQHLNEELGGGINIHTVDKDTLIAEDLIEMVSKGDIPLTIVDSDIARVNKTYYPELDINMPVSFPQRSSWAVRKNSQWLADSIDAWISDEQERQENAMLLKRYFELSKGNDLSGATGLNLKSGIISPYDQLFQQYAPELGWDWRLMAAQSFVESRFKNDAVSWAGARGIMQIMPRTARAYKTNPSDLKDPVVSIETAIKIIKDLDKQFAKRVSDPGERLKFVLAAYNSGPAHIYDAIALAKKTGKNPEIWDGNVEAALALKANPEYYNDPVVKYGYFRARETTNYVKQIMDYYSRFKQNIK